VENTHVLCGLKQYNMSRRPFLRALQQIVIPKWAIHAYQRGNHPAESKQLFTPDSPGWTKFG
jgi:hypothetical protein